MRLLRDERGQVAPLLAMGLLAAMIGVVGAVVDAASWYRAQRHVQAVADAAALAGVQALPGRPSAAVALAQEYAAKNGGAIAPPAVTANTISVDASEHAPAYFTRIFGFGGPTVHATAYARADAVSEAANVAPLAVPADAPALECGAPCFGQETTIQFGPAGAPGAFGLLDFSNGAGGVGVPTLASWIENGYPGTLPLGSYQSAPGNRWNAGPVRSALQSLVGDTVLVPVYSGVPQGSGANATYDVVGFAAFHVDSFDGSAMTGSFVQEIAHGTSGQGGQYFGVETVQLTGGGNGNGNCKGNGNPC